MAENNEEKELLSFKSNIEKKPITQEDINQEIDDYLGENKGVIQSFTKADYKLFKSLRVDVTKSYFVKGTQEKLKKFMAYFVLKGVLDRPSYSMVMLKEYVEGTIDRSDELSSLLGTERQLLFLYLHGETSGLGNTDAWIATTSLDKIATRNRKNLVTVVLSERDFSILENSQELITVNLGGVVTTKSVEEAAKITLQKIEEIKAKTGGNSSKYDQYAD